MGSQTKTKKNKKDLRHQRVRAKVRGTSDRPRAAVYRSNNHIYVQLIDDENDSTVIALNDSSLDKKQVSGKSKAEVAELVGKKLGAEAVKKGIDKVVFDRGGFRYHGRVKAVAEGLRKSGLKF